MMDLHRFSDIHTHNLDAGDDALICLPRGADVPPTGWYSVGIHPWDAAVADERDLEWLRRAAQSPNVVAIGEAGLDRPCGVDMDAQMRWFELQVRLSEQTGKPLIIHAVRTLSEVMQLRKRMRPTQRWIVHGFRGRVQLARQLLSHGIDISIGRRYDPEVPEVVPPDRLFHETD